MESCDVLIIGGGLAGIYTALNISKLKKVIVVIKESSSNSSIAQGGIAGELSVDNNVLAAHIEDTIVAGAGLNNKAAVESLVYEAKINLETLIELGVFFDLDKEGRLALTKEGGHRNRRILHAGGDQTGKIVMETLKKILKERTNISLLQDYMMYDLINKNNECFGAKFINHNGDLVNIFSNQTVIATGGIGGLYQASTNPRSATGDGIAAGIRAGVEVRHLEFVQFHPTVFYDQNKKNPERFLISEAVRGEGAYLLNPYEERFMKNYDERLELAPRDIVARAIDNELKKTKSNYVFIDARHLEKVFLKTRFPTIYNKCRESGYQMESDLIPVTPVEHFGIGGLKINLNGQTSMKNLFANGECASSGVHGANRLASNSLLECLVFGKRIASFINLSSENPLIGISNIFKETVKRKRNNCQELLKEIQTVMSEEVGIIRTTKGLENAKKIVQSAYQVLIKNPEISWEYYQCLNAATVSLAIITAALARKESIGCHYRED